MNRTTRMKRTTTINDNGEYCGDANSNSWLKKNSSLVQSEIFEGDGTGVSIMTSAKTIYYIMMLTESWPCGVGFYLCLNWTEQTHACRFESRYDHPLTIRLDRLSHCLPGRHPSKQGRTLGTRLSWTLSLDLGVLWVCVYQCSRSTNAMEIDIYDIYRMPRHDSGLLCKSNSRVALSNTVED